MRLKMSPWTGKAPFMLLTLNLDYLVKFSVDGKELQSFGGFDPGEKEFDLPQGIADTGNNRIVRFKLSTDVANK